ncbi:transposase, partial [Azospirillum brasilense]
MAYQRVEVLTGTERRRNYTPAEKVRMVEEAFRPGVVVTEAARRLGVHESLLYCWRGLMKATGTAMAEPSSFVAVTITRDCQEFRVRAGCDQVSENRSSNRMASWAFAMPHSRGGIFQSLV